jgi:threonine synthase
MSDHTTPVGSAVPTGKAPTATSPDTPADETHTPSQRYLSTRGGSYGVCDTFQLNLNRLMANLT